MQIQIISLPNCTQPPANLTPFPDNFISISSRQQLAKPGGSKYFPSWSCNLSKRVSRLQTNLRKYGSLFKVRAGVMEDEGVDHGFYMRKCVELARTAIGCTSPNPMVGCIIVKDGKIVGEGFHPKAGQPHAEVFALRNAGHLAEDATAYVSLEPCNHFGRTPPCTEALIKAKVKHVVVGMVDPNPIVASKGVDKLRNAGISVTLGVEEELCKRLNEAYIHQMLTGMPFLALRYSLYVNGRFVDQLGDGVTESGGYYSKLLQEYDAVILSAPLIEQSVPTSQEPGANQPVQIVVTRNPCRLPGFTKETSKTIVFVDKETATDSDLAQKGIEAVVLEQLNLVPVLEYCKRQGLCSVLLDMRGSFDDLEVLIREAIEQNLLQKLVIEILPFWDGSNGGDSLLALNSLMKRLEVKNLQSKISNKSIVLEGYLQHR